MNKVWAGMSILAVRQALVEDFSKGFKNPSEKEKRFIIFHIGCEERFVENSFLLFESK